MTRRRPGGFTTLFVLVGLVVLFGLLALAIDLRLVLHSHQQLQTASEAAALAGAAELMDPSLLYGLGPPTPEATWVSRRRDLLLERVTAARERAVQFASYNSAAGRPVRLHANPANGPQGEVVVGWIERPRQLGSPLLPLEPSIMELAPNAIQVRAERSRYRGSPVTFWFARLLNIPDVDVAATARATLDQRVYGFRPVDHVQVPLLPFLVPVAMRGNLWNGKPAPQGLQDRFRVDDHTGMVQVGPDGIPEMVFHIRFETESEDAPAPEPNRDEEEAEPGSEREDEEEQHKVRLVSLSAAPLDEAMLRPRMLAGLMPVDLVELGGQFALGGNGRLAVRARLPHPRQIAEIGQCLRAIHGQKRIWPLGGNVIEAGQDTVADVVGFGAGCVVNCTSELDGSLTVTVQPCLFQTCTALVREGQPRNPWIGKLYLN